MLTCALIVWLLQPENFDTNYLRNTYLTEQECKNKLKSGFICLKIDKRYDLTKKEWNKDNCSVSEHKWIGRNK
jgi:hypothetical protein